VSNRRAGPFNSQGDIMSQETLEFIARELSKPLPKGKKRRVWLALRGHEVIVDSRL
jgi:hypothetical protein